LVIECCDIEFAAGEFDPPDRVWRGFRKNIISIFMFPTEPIAALGNRAAIAVGRKVVRGSSAINGKFFDWGSRFDYDAWSGAQTGDAVFYNSEKSGTGRDCTPFVRDWPLG
jgi:hypothetical protein